MIKMNMLFISFCLSLIATGQTLETCAPLRQTISLLPSSPAVQLKLEKLREQKAAAVEVAKVEWEAELLLDLEEFRDKGGFDEVYKLILDDLNRNKESQEKQVAQLEDFFPDVINMYIIFRAYEDMSDTNVKNRVFPYVVTPMNLERAILRHRILSKVRTEIYTSVTP